MLQLCVCIEYRWEKCVEFKKTMQKKKKKMSFIIGNFSGHSCTIIYNINI